MLFMQFSKNMNPVNLGIHIQYNFCYDALIGI